jgi:hypothetical protein
MIPQPAHAWVAGQMARAWGNDDFPRPEPWEEVCLAAERHDDGWLAWEAAPTLDPETGQPFSFLALPRREHLAIWSQAGQTALSLGRYPALLVSLHGTGLYERSGAAREPGAEAEAVHAFLAQQQTFQGSLLADLQADPRFAVHATPEAIARNRRLIAVWDALSLAICGGARERREIGGVPNEDGETVLTIEAERGDSAQIGIAPWPFTSETVTLRFEGRRRPERSTDEVAMRAALAQAPWVSFAVRLTPVRASAGA